MVVTGWALAVLLVLLVAWLLLVCTTLVQRLATSATNARDYLAKAGLACAALAVGSLVALHLSWLSPDTSAHLGSAFLKVVGTVLFWASFIGFFGNVLGRGKGRVTGTVSCLISALWYLGLLITSALSMGPSSARHPIRYLIPVGYVGWVTVNYGRSAPALPLLNGTSICRIPQTGVLDTSSAVEEGWAQDTYFYYGLNETLTPLPNTGWGKDGMIWNQRVEWKRNDGNDTPKVDEKFFVGTEAQLHEDEGHAPNLGEHPKD